MEDSLHLEDCLAPSVGHVLMWTVLLTWNWSLLCFFWLLFDVFLCHFECGVVLFEVAQISSCVGWNVSFLFFSFFLSFMGKEGRTNYWSEMYSSSGPRWEARWIQRPEAVCKRKPKLFDCLLSSCLCLLFICFIILVTSLVWTFCLHCLLENDLYDKTFRFDWKMTCRLSV